MFAELHYVEPHNVQHPGERFGLESFNFNYYDLYNERLIYLDRVEVQGGTAFKEEVELCVGEVATVHVYLQCQEQSEEELVLLIEPSRRVFPDQLGQIIQNVSQPFLDYVSGLRLGD